MLQKILNSKWAYFFACYLAVSLISLPLAFFYWDLDDVVLLALFWPFYLGVIASDLMSPHETKHNGVVVMVHSEIFYTILMLGFAFAMGLLVRYGLKMERRRKGMWFVMFGLFLPANLTCYLLSQ